jgi:hypothetical protein
MDQLPVDVMLLLARLLDPVSLTRLGATCSRWLAISSRNDVWRDVCQRVSIAETDSDSPYDTVWKIVFLLRQGGKPFAKLPSFAFNFVRTVQEEKDVWLVLDVEQRFESKKCVLVRVEEVLFDVTSSSSSLAVGARFYMRSTSDLVPNRVMVRLTTHEKFSTVQVDAPDDKFPSVSFMSRVFQLEMKVERQFFLSC